MRPEKLLALARLADGKIDSVYIVLSKKSAFRYPCSVFAEGFQEYSFLRRKYHDSRGIVAIQSTGGK